jgi:hypothetical protein
MLGRAMESLPKICPSCRVEYVQSALRCADCDVALEAWSPEAAAAPVSRGGPALPPAAELVCLRTGTPIELEALAETLAAEGISSRIAGHPPEGPLQNPRRRSFGMGASMGIYVREEDARAAIPIVQEFLAASLGESLSGPDVGAELDACPACGTALEADAASCAECGLEFAGEPEA